MYVLPQRLFLLYAIRGALNPKRINLLWAGLWSAAALLTKLEFGLACFGALAVLQVGLDLAAAIMACGVLESDDCDAGSVDLRSGDRLDGVDRGVAFITQENFMSWPTSYFMQKYGSIGCRRMGTICLCPSYRKSW